MKPNLLEITNLSLRIDDQVILDDVTLGVGEGDYVSIIGPNGAGKTSLLRCLGRIYSDWTGGVNLAGFSLREYRQKELARLVSYVPQERHQLFPFTVQDFVTLGRYPHLSPFTSIGREDRAAVDEAIALVGADALRHRTINTLSGGERQMVLIAAALAQGARLLLLDEPISALDYRHQVDVIRLLTRINRESGVTIVSVNHDINIAALCSDQMIAIKQGRLFAQGRPQQIMRRELLEQIYDTPFRLIDRAPVPVPLAFPEGGV